jgi:hypothetical protein
MTTAKPAILCEYIFSVGLRLSARLEDLFEIEVRPTIEAATTRQERIALQDGWQVMHFSRGGSHRYWEKGKVTLGRERVVAMLLRQLRSLDFVAVGQVEFLGEVGPLQLIMPVRWDNLIVTWGSDTATDDLAVIRGIHVARVDRLGEPQRRELDKLLYSLSKQRVAETTENIKEGGRPPRQREMVEAWIRAKQASAREMPEKEAVARSQALQHFASQIAAKKISEETIRKAIKAFYSSEA